MEHLSKTLNKEGLLDKLLDLEVTVSLKIDGAAFQIVVNDNGEIEWHKRSGNSNKPGPIIDEFTLLYSPHLEKAVNYFTPLKEQLKEYRFLTFEIFNDNYILLSAIKGDTVVTDAEEMNKIAERLGVELVPVIYAGKLNDMQKDAIKKFLNETDNFDEFLKDAFNFDAVQYGKFLKGANEVEGVVLNYNVEGKAVQYKIVDPEFTYNVKKKDEAMLEIKEKTKSDAEKLTKDLLDWMEQNAQKLDDNHWKSLNMNFISLAKDVKTIHKLMNIAAKLPVSKFKASENLLDTQVKRLIKNNGQPMATVYENFLMMFNKKRTRHHIINKETQEKINKVVETI